jgi:hypothetical protein
MMLPGLVATILMAAAGALLVCDSRPAKALLYAVHRSRRRRRLRPIRPRRMDRHDWLEENWDIVAMVAGFVTALALGAALSVAYNVTATWVERSAATVPRQLESRPEPPRGIATDEGRRAPSDPPPPFA